MGWTLQTNMPNPSVELEAFITCYCRPEVTQKTISSFRASGGHDVKLTLLDNSPEPQKYIGVDVYYHFPFNPSLTRTWNWSIAMCKTPWVLVANDDVRFKPGWRDVFMNSDHMNKSKLHHKFDAFFMHRSLIAHVGWFDERFTTWYWEDVDYARRMAELQIPWCRDCLVKDHIESDKPDPGHYYYKIAYSRKDNQKQYEEKWGDANNNWIEGGKPKIPEINYYPCVQLPS